MKEKLYCYLRVSSKKQKEEGVTKRLIAFELTEKGIPRQGYEIVSEDGTVIGEVTSGTMSPSLKKGIGMGYVVKAYSKRDTEIFIQVRKKAIPATIVRLPFYKG
jgi:aminomethyltransferase